MDKYVDVRQINMNNEIEVSKLDEVAKSKSHTFVKRSALDIIFNIILPILLVVIFFVRLHLHFIDGNEVDIRDLSIVNTSVTTLVNLAKGKTILATFAIWFEYILVISLLVNTLHKVKTIKYVISFFSIPIILINALSVKTITDLFVYGHDGTLFMIFYIIEMVLCLALSIKQIIDIIILGKISTKQIFLTFGIFVLLMIPTLPTFFLQMMFGTVRLALVIKKITFAHRIFIYLAFIIPLVLYFALRNKSKEVIDFSLLYISLGVVVGFMINYNYKSFLEPWGLPLHLCNTALYIIPICLVFKAKKLFYFTYFINVIGALLAMLMPNTGDSTFIATEMVRFWYNHWVAFFMPILIVGLKVFERPKLKHFAYSMVAFFIYFILVLTLNVVNTSFGHETDYFFINSDFITDKFGQFGDKIFSIKVAFNIGSHELVFRPVYQIIFYFVYVALGFAELFLYYEVYRIADSHDALHKKLKLIKNQQIHFESMLTDEDRWHIKEDNMETKLELEHVFKKYSTNKDYSVKDVSLSVEGGEIFGFLGPNGAGKSTIIKSIVGIHPVTSGEIKVCGYSVQNQPVLAKYHIGYVPDHYALYEKLTGREYINYIADIFEVSKEERDARLTKYIHLFELENAIDNKIATYSHGMKQKITIMAALVHNPKVWILDEPLTGLDPNSIYQVKQCMKLHASEGNIVFFSSHLIDIVEKLCDKVAIIKKGELQCVDSVEEIEKKMPLEEFYMTIINNTPSLDAVEEKHE